MGIMLSTFYWPMICLSSTIGYLVDKFGIYFLIKE